MAIALFPTSFHSDIDEEEDGDGDDDDDDDDEESTISFDSFITEDDWFKSISANADWANIHTYVPKSNSGSDSSINLDTDSSIDLDTGSNPDANLDSYSAADLDSDPELVLDFTAPVWSEHIGGFDFGNGFEPITPQAHAFGAGEPIAVHLIPVFVPITTSYNSTR